MYKKDFRKILDKKIGFNISKIDKKDYNLIYLIVQNHFKKLLSNSVLSTKKINFNNYEKHSNKINHSKIFEKKNRILSLKDANKVISSSMFVKKLKIFFPEMIITDEENLGYPNIYWRLVRPYPFKDAGLMHKDKWFWDLGNVRINEKKFQRLKLWISLDGNCRNLGFKFVPGSAGINYNYSSERRNNILKPKFDESVLKKKHIKSLNGSKGTFIIFHDEMLHGGNILKNSCCRVSIEFTFLIYKKNI